MGGYTEPVCNNGVNYQVNKMIGGRVSTLAVLPLGHVSAPYNDGGSAITPHTPNLPSHVARGTANS